MPALLWLAVDVGVGEQTLVGAGVIAPVEAQDDDVHVGLAAGIGHPGEGGVRKRDFERVAIEQDRPQLRDLLALGDRVRRDESNPRSLGLPHVVAYLDEPRGDVVEGASAFAERGDRAHLRPLFGTLVLRAGERGIPEHERALLGGEDFGPVRLERVGVHDVGRLLQGDPDIGLAELDAQAVVHDVVHHPQRRLRDAHRELADLDPVELVDVDAPEREAVDFADDFHLEQTQLAVGDDEEVAAPACGVEQPELGESVLEPE